MLRNVLIHCFINCGFIIQHYEFSRMVGLLVLRCLLGHCLPRSQQTYLESNVDEKHKAINSPADLAAPEPQSSGCCLVHIIQVCCHTVLANGRKLVAEQRPCALLTYIIEADACFVHLLHVPSAPSCLLSLKLKTWVTCVSQDSFSFFSSFWL